MQIQTPTLQKFQKNQTGSDYVVGDIHGMYDLLIKSLIDIEFNFLFDRLFAVGDLIDRGPNSFKCLNLCYEPWFYSVRGNHEQMAFDSVIRNSEPDINMWFSNGGSWFAGYDSDELRSTFHDLDERLPYGIQVETDNGLVGIVHADVFIRHWEDNFTNDNYINQVLIWSRKRIEKGRGLDVVGIDRLYVGHTPVSEVTVINNVHHIDSGVNHSKKFFIEKIS